MLWATEKCRSLRFLIEQLILNFKEWVFDICLYFFQDSQMPSVGHVGMFNKGDSTKKQQRKKRLTSSFPPVEPVRCLPPLQWCCAPPGQRFIHSFIHLFDSLPLFWWWQTWWRHGRTSCCASSSFFFFHSGIRSSSQLSSLLVKMKSSSLRMNTSARTWGSSRVTSSELHLKSVCLHLFSDQAVIYQNKIRHSSGVTYFTQYTTRFGPQQINDQLIDGSISSFSWGYHHGEDDCGPGRLDDPQQDQAAELDDGEEVHLPQRDVAKVDEVWLMLGRHAKQLQAVEKLQWKRGKQKKGFRAGAFSRRLVVQAGMNLGSPGCLWAKTPPCTRRLRTARAWGWTGGRHMFNVKV